LPPFRYGTAVLLLCSITGPSGKWRARLDYLAAQQRYKAVGLPGGSDFHEPAPRLRDGYTPGADNAGTRHTERAEIVRDSSPPGRTSPQRSKLRQSTRRSGGGTGRACRCAGRARCDPTVRKKRRMGLGRHILSRLEEVCHGLMKSPRLRL
jgi:hypothetical protein